MLLVTETDGPAKAWPATKWESLAAQLRRRFDVRQVTRTAAGGDLDPLAVPALPLPNPGAAVDALSSCRGVIGIDTGLTHIAVQQRTPTVTICRHGSVYFRPWPHARALRGAPCDAACLAEERTSAYNERVSLRGLPMAAPDVPLRAAVPGRAATGAGGAPVRRAGVRMAAGADQPVEVDAHSEVGVRNSQPEGIGRVADLGDLVAWNNLGRNVVFADRRWQPVAVFGTTSFRTTTSSPSTTSTCTPSSSSPRRGRAWW